MIMCEEDAMRMQLLDLSNACGTGHFEPDHPPTCPLRETGSSVGCLPSEDDPTVRSLQNERLVTSGMTGCR